MKQMANFKKVSQRQERDIAKCMNGRAVIASGALWGAKGDVRTDDYLIEAKITTKVSYYTLHVDTWEKIEAEAAMDNGRIPLIFVDIEKGNTRLVVFKAKDFKMDMGGDLKAKRSIRLTSEMRYLPFRIFRLDGKYKNILVCMEFTQFKKKFMEGK